MTRTLTRTNLHSSRLIRVLTNLALVDAAEPGSGFAEDLSLWVDLNHAITLRMLHNARSSSHVNSPTAEFGAKLVIKTAMGDEFARVRDGLVTSMDKGGVTSVARTQLAMLCTPAVEPEKAVMAYEPYRRYYVALQRDMNLAIRPLRTKVRGVLAQASPTLKALADLDATFDGVLSDREGKLLATVPSLLERRYVQLYTTHQKNFADALQDDNPALWMKPGAWLARFCHELQTVMLAELDVRLQPTQGLIEAFDNEI